MRNHLFKFGKGFVELKIESYIVDSCKVLRKVNSLTVKKKSIFRGTLVEFASLNVEVVFRPRILLFRKDLWFLRESLLLNVLRCNDLMTHCDFITTYVDIALSILQDTNILNNYGMRASNRSNKGSFS